MLILNMHADSLLVSQKSMPMNYQALAEYTVNYKINANFLLKNPNAYFELKFWALFENQKAKMVNCLIQPISYI